MAWWDDLFSSFSPQSMFDSAAPAQVRDQVMKWLGYFAANAVTAAGPNVLDPDTCDFCNELGLLDCQVCGARVCLAHSFVNHQAQAVCHECVRGVVGTKEDQRRARDQQHRERKAQRAQRRPNPDEKLVAALKELNLEKGSSWEDVKAAYRFLALKNHPDRAKSAAGREKAEAKLKKINAAFEVLKAHYERAA